jgi:hypothetical protein
MSRSYSQAGSHFGWLTAAALGLASVASAGCTAQLDTARPVTADEVYVDAPPAIAAAPTAVYQGQTIYYVNGRWYRPAGRRWTYYRTAPPGVVRQRPYVQAAPPAAPARAGRAYGGGPRYPERPDDAVRVR